jgi:hypothetical protein
MTEQVNGKSIMGLMMLAAGRGAKVRFIATGRGRFGHAHGDQRRCSRGSLMRREA